MNFPLLTTYHTLDNSQGTLDPLGLYTISDRLATRLAPGLRERMKHPRYLTAIAVGSVVCSPFDENELAKDELSPPWQVYEWYVASALVKRYGPDDPGKQLLGMPGREKTTRCMRENVPLNASRYLKTPSVFGFHGVYRTLAKNIKLVDEDAQGEFGLKLVDVWEREQGLPGFLVNRNGSPGKTIRSKLYDAVCKGLEAAAVAKPWSWEQFIPLAEKLAPKAPGKQESILLMEELQNGSSGARAGLLAALLSREGQQALLSGQEKGFHAWLLENSLGDENLLEAIAAYENFCRLLYNAFYEILLLMRNQQSRGSIEAFSQLQSVKKGCSQLPDNFMKAENALMPFADEYSMFQEAFSLFGQKLSIREWIRTLLGHHVNVQRDKLPAGKAPWILEHGSSSYLLNTTQYLDMELNDEYVHQYRSYSIYSFLKDLGQIA